MSDRERAVVTFCFIALLNSACSASGVSSSMATGGRSSRGTGGATAGTGDSGGTGQVTFACNSNLESTGCTPGQISQTGTLTGKWGAFKATDGTREYFIQVNEWGSAATQSMTYGGSSFFTMTQQAASLSGSGAPAGYPSAFIGANTGHVTANSGLPKQVSTLGQVLTTWNWVANGAMDDTANNVFNAAYDVWFSTNAAGDPAVSIPSAGYLMVWYYAQGCQPIGALLDAGHTISGLPGCWDVWGGLNNGKPVISYKHQGPLMSFGFDLNLFIQDALNSYPDYMNTSWYLTNIFSGFEIWKGGVNLESTSFCAEVN